MNASDFKRITEQLKERETAELTFSVDGESFTRRFVPKDRLILLGGGHIAQPLCRIASMLEFSVTVVDDRPMFANTERFPEADEIICDSFENAIDHLMIDRHDYVCVITRGHRWDKACVKRILSGKMPFYLGMIGSRRRVQGLKETLLEEGFSAEMIERLHAPIGLSIGAATTAEIAVSIVAELIQCRRATVEKVGENLLAQKNTDLEMLEFLAESSEPRAVLLVLSSFGSTPVKSGAMMAVDRFGSAKGTIGGGCSEAAAMAKARRVIGTGERRIVEVDMSDDVAAENGMVCGGRMTVLIEDIRSL